MDKADETMLEEMSPPVRETQQSKPDEVLIEAHTPSIRPLVVSQSGVLLSKRSRMGFAGSLRFNRREFEGTFIRLEVYSRIF